MWGESPCHTSQPTDQLTRNQSGGRIDPNFITSYNQIRTSGITNIDGYFFPCKSSRTPTGLPCANKHRHRVHTQLQDPASTGRGNSRLPPCQQHQRQAPLDRLRATVRVLPVSRLELRCNPEHGARTSVHHCDQGDGAAVGRRKCSSGGIDR